jgi:hypothetical protein
VQTASNRNLLECHAYLSGDVVAVCSHLLTLEAIRSSETSVHTRSTRRHIPEDGILHGHRCENLKSYKFRLSLYFSSLNF